MTNSPSDPPTSSADLGLTVRRHRRQVGLTQEELAERAGISARAVSDIERGLRTGVYRDTADRLASALRLDQAARAELLSIARRGPAATRKPGSLPPVPPTPLFGRSAELRQIGALLAAPATRLITLTGPPGVGKSRLALEAAHTAAPALSGAWFVPLAPVSSVESVPSAVLRALDLPDSGDSQQRILRFLPPGALLVIDNFEHVLDAGPWLGELLDASSALTILASSRAPLRLRAETEFAVEPLDPQASADLFRERSAAVRRNAVWGDEEQRLASRICERLDRLPLALELGAAALSHLTLLSLAEALDDHLDVLGAGWRDMPARHRSMNAAVAWSLDLLAPPDRELLEALAVFAGTIGVDAAGAVAALERPVTIQRLARLVEQSLVSMAGPVQGQPRYQLLEVVRQTAREDAAASGRLAEFRRRHLDHFVALAEAAEPHLHAARRPEWSVRLASESDNLEAALEWAAESGDADLGLRMATALWRWWRQRGTVNSGRTHFRRLLALPGSSTPVRSRALWGASWLALHQQDTDEARRWSEELIRLSEATGDKMARRNALTGLGMVARYEGRYAESLPQFREALELAREVDDPWILATSIFNVGQPLLEVGAFAEGEEVLEEARLRYIDIGDQAFAARMLLYRARAAVLLNELNRAAGYVLEAIAVFRDLEEPWGQVECLEVAAAILASLGRDEIAAAALGTAEATHALVGSAALAPDVVLTGPIIETARRRAGDTWAGSRAAGADRTLADALAEVLDELRALSSRPDRGIG